MNKDYFIKKAAIKYYLKVMSVVTLTLVLTMIYFVNAKIEVNRKELKKDLGKRNFILKNHLEDDIFSSLKWLGIYREIGVLEKLVSKEGEGKPFEEIIKSLAGSNKNVNEVSIFNSQGEKIQNYYKTNSEDRFLKISTDVKKNLQNSKGNSLFIDLKQHSNRELDIHFYTEIQKENEVAAYIGISYGLNDFFSNFKKDFKEIFNTKNLGVLSQKELNEDTVFFIDVEEDKIKELMQSKIKTTSSFVIKKKIEESLSNYFGNIVFNAKFGSNTTITSYVSHEELNNVIFNLVKQYIIFTGLIFILLSFTLWLYILEKTKKISTFKEVKLYNVRLRKTLETKDMLFSIIGHDLRSPFTSQLGYFQMLQRKFDTYEKEEIKKIIDIMSVSCEKLSILTENILRWSAIHNKKIEYKPENLKINEIIKDYEEIFKIQLESKELNLEVNIDKDSTVKSDKNLLEASVRNLISNAIKYSKKGGNIRVFAKEDKNFVSLSIEDEGVGIPDEIQNHVLKGNQVSTAGTYNEKGIGLGLYVVREFTKINGGKVSFESEEGMGTKFTLLIPKA